MKKKYIDFYERREEAIRLGRKQKRGFHVPFTIGLVVILLLAGGFLAINTYSLNHRTKTLQTFINDPANSGRYEEVQKLNKRENSYKSTIKNLGELKEIKNSYPHADRDYFDHIMKGNDPGVILGDFNYDGNSGTFSMNAMARDYQSWTRFIDKIENSSYMSEYHYTGYDRSEGSLDYYASFSFILNPKEVKPKPVEGEPNEEGGEED